MHPECIYNIQVSQRAYHDSRQVTCSETSHLNGKLTSATSDRSKSSKSITLSHAKFKRVIARAQVTCVKNSSSPRCLAVGVQAAEAWTAEGDASSDVDVPYLDYKMD